MTLKWIKILTHMHTLNSDGANTLKDMAEAARKASLDVVFLTDHNTIAGWQDAEDISDETGVKIIKAIEYTTFYGHVVVMGAPYFRWENLKNTSLNQLADFVHKHNGIIGIAHPMGIGDPICTGCSFNFKDVDFSKIDFMEVWHGVTNKFNEWEKNENFWINKLEEGISITALYGGDFHSKEHFKESNAFNWLLIDETLPIEAAIKQAIKAGRVVMSKGPCFNMTIEKNSNIYNMGDVIAVEENDTSYSIIFDMNTETIDRKVIINLVDNIGRVKKVEYEENNKICVKIYVDSKIKWIRAELVDEINNEALAISNPIYFK